MKNKPAAIVRFCVRYFVSVLCVLYVHTVGIFFRKGRSIVRLINREFGFTFFDRNSEPVPKIPSIGIEEICSGKAPITVLAPELESGGISPLELICMDTIVAHFKPERIFEIGTFNGRTTLNLAANSAERSTIFSLDLPLCETVSTSLQPHPWDRTFVAERESGRYFRNRAYAGKIQQLYGDSATFDYRPYAETIDLVFIDGSHSYDYVMNDSEKVLALLKNGNGILIWHDYDTDWHDVTHALNDLFEKNTYFAGMRRIRGTSLVWLRND
jgi:hypothetical protein